MESVKPTGYEVVCKLDTLKGHPADYREKRREEVREWAKTQPNGGVGVKETFSVPGRQAVVRINK